MPRIAQSQVLDLDLGVGPADPWAELDVEVDRPDGSTVTVPAFVSGGCWRFRYSSELVGEHRYRAGDASGTLTVDERASDTTGLARGGIRVTADGRRFEHADGAPFLWTGDTWWHGFVTEKISDDEFRELAQRRADEGFSVVQIVVLPPEAETFEESVRCRTGWAWEEDFAAPNLAWFDDADFRVQALVEAGIVPCIVGSWGYHLRDMGSDRVALRHWRELVARWAAYPVTWCLAGEPTLVHVRPGDPIEEPMKIAPGAARHLSEMVTSKIPAAEEQFARLDLVARTLRERDPFRRPVTTHTIPGQMSWDHVSDDSTLDFWMLQTGHGGYADIPNSVNQVRQGVTRSPAKPVVNGEASYEGIGGMSWEDVQRMLFWSNILSGAAGFTYGAHGVWAMNTDRFPGQLSGTAPTWQEASRFRGGRHVGAGSRWLRGLDLTTVTPRGDLVTPSQSNDNRLLPYGAELGDGTRLIYLPPFMVEGTFLWRTTRFERLGGRPWRARLVDVRTGTDLPEFTLEPGEGDAAPLPPKARPSWEDWLVVLTPA